MSKLTTKNYRVIKNYAAKHTAKEVSKKYGIGSATVYLIKRNATFEDYKSEVAEASRRARERKAFVESFNNENIIVLKDEPVSMTEDQRDFIFVLGLVLMAILGLSYALVRIIL